MEYSEKSYRAVPESRDLSGIEDVSIEIEMVVVNVDFSFTNTRRGAVEGSGRAESECVCADSAAAGRLERVPVLWGRALRALVGVGARARQQGNLRPFVSRRTRPGYHQLIRQLLRQECQQSKVSY